MPGDGKTYDTSEVDVGEFIERFDNLMEEKFELYKAVGDTSEYRRFGGKSFREVGNAAWNCIKHYDKSLSDIWADALGNGHITVEKLRENIGSAMTRLDEIVSYDDDYIEDLGDNKADLENVISAKNAVDAVIGKRTLFTYLWPGNWSRISSENKLQEELSAKLEVYRGKMPVDVISGALASRPSMLNGVADKLKDFYEEKYKPLNPNDKKKPKEKDNDKTKTAKPTSTPKVSNANKAEELFIDSALTERMKDQIGNILVQAGVEPMLANLLKGGIYANAVTAIRNNWGEFGNAEREGANPEATVSSLPRIICENTLDSMPGIAAREGLVAAQKITDLMLNTYSPVASDSKYGDNYYVQNAPIESIRKYTEFTGDANELMESVHADLGITKTQMHIDSLGETFNSKETVKIETQDVPTKDFVNAK